MPPNSSLQIASTTGTTKARTIHAGMHIYQLICLPAAGLATTGQTMVVGHRQQLVIHYPSITSGGEPKTMFPAPFVCQNIICLTSLTPFGPAAAQRRSTAAAAAVASAACCCRVCRRSNLNLLSRPRARRRCLGWHSAEQVIQVIERAFVSRHSCV